MRYKFSIPSRIRSTVEWHLEHYPEDVRQLERYKNEMVPSPVQAYSPTAGVDGGEAHRSTEDVAFRIVTSPYIRMMEITCRAIQTALDADDEITRRLVELIYWKREYTAEGAGLKLNLSKTAVYQRLNKLLGRIAFEMGYVSI